MPQRGRAAGVRHCTADTWHARELIVEIDVRVVRQELPVVGAGGRKEADQHQRCGQRLLHRDAEVRDLDRQLRRRLTLTQLREDQVGIGLGLHIEVDNQPHFAGR